MPCFNVLSLDTALFSADVFTDFANGINLYTGPDTDATVNETEGASKHGSITKPHPVWGVMMLSIPFLPMMVAAPIVALMFTEEKGLCTRIGLVLLAIVLSLPFTAVFTPAYVLFVIGVGVFRVIAPKKVDGNYKISHGLLKTAEISLESAIQTCLGKKQPLSTLQSSPFSGLYIVVVLGVSTNPIAITLQLGGILISTLSLTKGVAEYQLTCMFRKENSIGKPSF